MLVETYGQPKKLDYKVIPDCKDLGGGHWELSSYRMLLPKNDSPKSRAVVLSLKQMGLLYNLGRLESLDELTDYIGGIKSATILQEIFSTTDSCDKQVYYDHMHSTGLGHKSLDEILEAIRSLSPARKSFSIEQRKFGNVIQRLKINFPFLDIPPISQKLLDMFFIEQNFPAQNLLTTIEPEILAHHDLLISQTPLKPLRTYTI